MYPLDSILHSHRKIKLGKWVHICSRLWNLGPPTLVVNQNLVLDSNWFWIRIKSKMLVPEYFRIKIWTTDEPKDQPSYNPKYRCIQTITFPLRGFFSGFIWSRNLVGSRNQISVFIFNRVWVKHITRLGFRLNISCPSNSYPDLDTPAFLTRPAHFTLSSVDIHVISCSCGFLMRPHSIFAIIHVMYTWRETWLRWWFCVSGLHS